MTLKLLVGLTLIAAAMIGAAYFIAGLAASHG